MYLQAVLETKLGELSPAILKKNDDKIRKAQTFKKVAGRLYPLHRAVPISPHQHSREAQWGFDM
jgi:hypothetical protein